MNQKKNVRKIATRSAIKNVTRSATKNVIKNAQKNAIKRKDAKKHVKSKPILKLKKEAMASFFVRYYVEINPPNNVEELFDKS